MALPTWVNFGAIDHSTASLTPTMPASTQADDIALLFCHSEQAETVALSTANGFVETASSPQRCVQAGAGRLTCFWKRLIGGDAAPVIADPGDHVLGVMCAIRGCKTSGNPWNITSGSTSDPTSTTTHSIPGATTTAADCLVVCVAVDQLDTVSARITTQANAAFANITERVDGGTTDGGGAGIGVWTGEKAVAGVYGATTYTNTAGSDFAEYATFALEGAAAVATDARTWRNVEAGASGPSVAVSEQSKVGFFGGYAGRG